MDLEIINLGGAQVRPLIDFYSGLSPAVTRFYQPFGDDPAQAIGPHLAGADAGEHISIGLAEGLALRGHCFVLNLSLRHPVFGLGIHQDYQGSGYGRRMTEQVLAKTDGMGIRRVTLTVIRENQRALALYKSVGFVVKCLHTFRITDDSYLMERIV